MPTPIHNPDRPERGFGPRTPAGSGAPPGAARVLAAIDAAEAAPAPPDDKTLAYAYRNDLGNARRLIARHGDGLAWCKEVGWLAWDGKRWSVEDGAALAQLRAQETAEAIFAEREALEAAGPLPQEDAEAFELRLAKAASWAVSSGNHSRAETMLKAAAPHLRARLTDFDADPWVLNVTNGMLRLDVPREPGMETCAALYPHAKGARITKLAGCAYQPEAECPRWLEFVGQVFEGAEEVLHYLQKLLGYCLTGDIGEQKVFFLFGDGSNGKSKFPEALATVLGDYVFSTPVETFLFREHKSGSGPSPDLARLPAARIVRTSEPEKGARLSESIVKQISSGEPLTTRHLQRDFFEFKPACKLLFSTNHMPVIVGKDHGIKRRIVVIPFARTFPEDPLFAARLERIFAEEASGILNWLIEGLTSWWDEGLRQPPAAVVEATAAYFAEMDPIGQFVAEDCVRSPDGREMATVLYQAYRNWCETHNETPKEQTAFGRRLGDMGHKTGKSGGLVYRLGLQLKPEARPIVGGGGSGKGEE